MLESSIPALESSKDSRQVVCLFAFAWTAIWLIAFNNSVIMPAHRANLRAILTDLGTNEMAAAVFISLIIAAVGVYLLDFHEAIYDRFFVKWRARHEMDYILPRLFGPFRESLTSDYPEKLKADARTLVMKVFCPFVSGKDYRLDSRFVVRFYQALTLYWVAELTELAIIFWIVGTFFYAAWGSVTQSLSPDWPAILLFQVFGAIVLGTMNNLFFVRAARNRVRDRTGEEIDEIMRFYKPVLEEYVIDAARQLGFFRPAPAVPVSTAAAARPAGETQIEQDLERVFVSSPMASLPTADEYTEDRDLMSTVAQTLRETCGFPSVYYAGEQFPEQTRFDDVYYALVNDLREIRKSGVFIFHYPKKLPSSCLFELGYALALRKHVLILIRDQDDLPFLLQGAAQLGNVNQYRYKSREHLLWLLPQAINRLLHDDGIPAERQPAFHPVTSG